MVYRHVHYSNLKLRLVILGYLLFCFNLVKDFQQRCDSRCRILTLKTANSKSRNLHKIFRLFHLNKFTSFLPRFVLSRKRRFRLIQNQFHSHDSTLCCEGDEESRGKTLTERVRIICNYFIFFTPRMKIGFYRMNTKH